MPERDLSTLADLAAQLPSERRQQIEKQLPSPLAPQFEAGRAAGFAVAAEIAAGQSEEAARALREVAAVAAARAIAQRQLYDEAARLFDTPEARAEVEAEFARIKSGEATMYSMSEVLDELDAMVAAHEAARRDKPDSKAG